MIERATGEVTLASGVRLGPALTRKQLLASPLGKGVEEKPRAPWITIRTANQRISGREFLVVLYFHEDALKEIHLSDDDPKFGTSWDDADEVGKKAAHDGWLKSLLGDPPYAYPWGEVFSTYDPRAEYSSITVRFGKAIP